MINYQVTYYNPNLMPINCHMGDPIPAESPFQAASEYLEIMLDYEDEDDDKITEIFVYDVDADERIIGGYKVDADGNLIPMEGDLSPLRLTDRCPETPDLFLGEAA